MSGKHSVGTALVILMAISMAFSPIAMAAPGVASGGGDAAEDVSVGDVEVHTQSTDAVEIADELEHETAEEEVVEVFVRLDAAESTQYVETTGDDQPSGDSQAALQQEAEITQAQLEAHADELGDGMEIVNEFWITNAALVEVDTSQVDLDRLASIDGVSELHPNYEVEHVEPEEEPASEAFGEKENTYGVEQINAPQFWNSFDSFGDGATVAVVDTGVNPTHETFADYDTDNWAEFDFDGNEIDSEPYDENGHGTHVAGTVLGGDESGTQIGVAPDAELLAINVFPDPDGGTTLAAIVAGMEEAVEEGADVANFSLGGAGYASVYIDVVKNAKAAGTFIVTSSGNSGPGSTGTPANVYNASAIGASDESGAITDFSTGTEIDTAEDWGYVAPDSWPDEYVTPDVAAPGAAVQSAYVPGDETYSALSGTSMAAPHVSGAAALLMAEFDLEPREVREVLEETATKPDEIDQAVIDDALEVSDEQAENLENDDVRDVRYGYGIIDVYAAGLLLEDVDTSIEGTVTDGEEPVADATVDLVGIETTETDEDGEYAFDVLPGEYDLTASEFGGFGDATVDVEDDQTKTVDIELEDIVDVAPVQGQPSEIPANNDFDIVVDVANLENLTVDLSEEADVSGDDLTVTLDEDELTLGEPVDFEESLTGEATLNVNVTAEEGDVVELAHTFSGPGEDIDVITGPTNVLDEDAESAPITITEWDPPEEVFFNEPSPVFVEIENPGDFSEDVTLNHLIDDGDAPLLLDTQATVESGETKEVMLGPYNWWVIGGPGTVLEHKVAVNDLPPSFGGEPDDVSEFETTELTGSGPITGTVTDEDTGEPVTGATVTAENPDGNVFTTTTDITGSYTITDSEEVPAAEYHVTVEVGGYEAATDNVAVDSDGDRAEANFELSSDPTYALSLDAEEPTAFGIPGPVEADTLGEVVETDVPGTMYAYDAEANDWDSVGADHEVDALDAFVFVPDGESADAVLEIAETEDITVPSSQAVENGWNFVSPTEYAEANDALSLAGANVVADRTTIPFEAPNSSMAPESATEDGISPFTAYFQGISASDDNPEQLGALDNSGLSLAEANEELGVDTDRVEGVVVGEFSGEPITAAAIQLEGTTFDAQTGPDGEFGFNNVVDDGDLEVTVEADGFVDDTVAVDDGTVTLQEEEFLGVTDFEAPDSAEVGDEIEVTYEVTNFGAEAIEKQVDVAVGQNVEFARGDDNTYTLDTRTIALEPDESETITITEEVGNFQPLGPQEIAVITDSTGLEPDDIDILPFTIADVNGVDQALSDEDQVAIDDVAASEDSWVAVTYTEDEDEIIAGVTQLEEDAMGQTVAVDIEDDGGFPGEHTAHVIPELSDETADDPIGSPVSGETVNSIKSQDSFDVFDAELEFVDQEFEDETTEVTVETATLLDGFEDETEFVVDLHPTDDEGEIIADEAVGQSDNLTGANSDEAIELEEAVESTDDFVAMLHEGPSDEPLSTPAIVAFDGEELSPVVDAGEVEIVSAEGAQLSFDEQAVGADASVFVDDLSTAEQEPVTQDEVTDPEDDFVVLFEGDEPDADAIVDFERIGEAEDGGLALNASEAEPGEHTVEIHADDGDGSPDPAAPRGAAETATVFGAELVFDDQQFEDETDEVTVETADLLDGADDDTEFVVDLHPTDDEGEIIADEAVGQSDNLTEANNDVTIELEESVESTDDFVAMLHEGPSDEPLSTPAIVAFDGEGLSPVVDAGEVEIVSGELTFNDQELEDGEVTVEDVTTAQESTVVVTYEDGDENVIAGLADADNLDEAGVPVEIEDDGGFPGEHTAWVFADEDVPEDIGIGDDATDVADDALDFDSAQVDEPEPEGELTFNDQELEDGEVTVEDVTTVQDSTIVVTYAGENEDGDDDQIVAGLAGADELDSEDVQVEIEDDGGFPGEHTAWVFDDRTLEDAEIGPGDGVIESTDFESAEEVEDAALDFEAADVNEEADTTVDALSSPPTASVLG